jgi:UDP-3-O-[3-hydroxymyristoyl] glucosamine N-acyltransferase
MMTTLQEVATLVGGVVAEGDGLLPLTGFSSIAEAEAGDITFLGNPRYAPALKKTRASAVLVDEQFQGIPPSLAVIRVPNPTLKFSLIVQRYGPTARPAPRGIHPTAIISPSAQLDPAKVSIGPCVVIEDDAVVGDGATIAAGAYIGHSVKLGSDCVIYANVVIKERTLIGNRVIIHANAAIGTDGFGYEMQNGRNTKIDQVGIVQIDDDVEIGSCTAIDRARFGRTWIGEGTKIDNLVQIGHNCIIGKHCILCGQVGISGSTRLGDFVVMAGQVGVAGHLNIGSKTTFLAKSGLTKDYPEPGAYTGYPAKPLLEGRRMLTYPARVPELVERIKELEARVAALDGRSPSPRKKDKPAEE